MDPRGAAVEHLDPDDAKILALESESIYGHTTKVIILDPPRSGEGIGLADLTERVDERAPRIERLLQRVEIPDDDPSLAFWTADGNFDVSRHVTERSGRRLDADGFRDAVREAMQARLDHSIPLWQLELIQLTEGRSAVIARIHHCMADGVSSVRILSEVLFDENLGKPKTGGSESGKTAPKESAGASGASSPGRPRLKTLMTLVRELVPTRRTALAKRISSERDVAWAETTLSRMKRIGKGAGDHVTVNDVALAAVACSLEDWLHGDGRSPKKIKAQVPVSLHHQAPDKEIGNRDSFLFVDLPLDRSEPLEKLHRINRETEERKASHDAETLYDFFHAPSRIAHLSETQTRLLSGPREFTLSVSNVPGPRDDASVLGHPVSGLVTLAEPADRHALRIAIISMGDRITFGACSDPQAVEGVERIASGISDSLDRLEAAVSR